MLERPGVAFLIMAGVTVANAAAVEPRFPDPVFSDIVSRRDWITIAQGDFNGDGFADLALPDRDAGLLNLLFGNGAGDFTRSAHSVVGIEDVAAADIDDDGIDDVVAAVDRTGIVVLLGSTGGIFNQVGVLAGCGGEYLIDLQDLDDDGHEDIVALGFVIGSGSCLAVLLGRGRGEFEPAIVEPPSMSVAAYDFGSFNSDPAVDLVLAGSISQGSPVLLIRHGNGDGTFTFDPLVDTVALSRRATAVRARDVDGDGLTDLVYAVPRFSAGGTPPEVYVRLGRADGNFTDPLAQSVTLNEPPWALAPEDHPWAFTVDLVALDDDGALDLVVTGGTSGNGAALLGTGTGTFDRECTFWTPREGGATAFGDWNGDGQVDLAVASYDWEELVTLDGQPGGCFGSPRRRTVETDVVHSVGDLAIADFDGDGRSDLALGRYDDLSRVWFNEPDGSFAGPFDLEPYVPAGNILAADHDGDGRIDIIGSGSSSFFEAPLLFRNGGDRSFEYGQPLLPAAVRRFATGRLNDDAELDYVYADDYSTVLQVKIGRDGLPVPLDVGVVAGDFTIADLNADGSGDLLVTRSQPGELSVFRGNGDGSFQAPTRYPLGEYAGQVEAADLDRDRHLDVIVSGRSISVLLGSPVGELKPPIPSPVPAARFVLGDVNDDRRLDLVLSSRFPVVALGNGDGTFGPAESYLAPAQPKAIGVGDFDGDAWNDLAVLHYYRDVAILENRGPTVMMFASDRVTLGWPRVRAAAGYLVYRGLLSRLQDDDDDGLPDLGFGRCQADLRDQPNVRHHRDETVPPLGDGFFYLRAVVEETGVGDLGSTSAGQLRPVPSCSIPDAEGTGGP